MTDELAALEIVRSASGIDLVHLRGDIDMASAPALEDRILDRIAGGRGVVIDLGSVTHLDSAGVRLLDGVVRTCMTRDVAVRLVAPETAPAGFVLTLSEFRANLRAPSLEAALATMPGGGPAGPAGRPGP
jgi:anti-anti-sigma factor